MEPLLDHENRIIALEKELRDLKTRARGYAWGTFTAGLFQGAAVTATVTFARYKLAGRTMTVSARLVATGAGVGGGNTLALTGLPVAPRYHDTPIGLIEVYDASAGIWYIGGARTQATFGSGLYVWGIVSGANNVIGVNPAITLAANDIVTIHIETEIA